MLSIIKKISDITIDSNTFEKHIEEVLSQIGTTTDVSRVFISKLNKKQQTLEIEKEWCTESIQILGIQQQLPISPAFQNFLANQTPPYLNSGEVFSQQFPDGITLPGVSFVLVPVQSDNSLWIIGFEEFYNKRDWQEDEINFFITISNMFKAVLRSQSLQKPTKLSTSLLHEVAQLSRDGIFIVQDDKYVYLNAAWMKMTEYSEEELTNRDILSIVEKKSKAQLINKIRNKQSIIEAKIISKSGKLNEVEASTSTITLGNKNAFVVIVRDITLRKQAERDKLKRLDRRKVESLELLAGGLAHDFNNLLMAIVGNTDLALMDLEGNSLVRSYLEEIADVSRRATELTEQMLAYSGRGHFMVRPINLSEAVMELNNHYRSQISGHHDLRLDLDLNLPNVEADRTQIRQMLMELITNASEAIGSIPGTITLETGQIECHADYLAHNSIDTTLEPGLYIFLRITDNGCGIAESAKETLFDPFFSTKFTGRGLGLAAVKGIVSGHKGGIIVSSTLGESATFEILFPISYQTEVATKPKQQVKWSGENNILLVDDERAVRVAGEQMLKRLGFNVITAEDGKAGIKKFLRNQHSITCVILDLLMPNMAGEETFSELRKINNKIPIILSSGYDEYDVTALFAGKALSGFLQKPYGMAELQDKLQKILGTPEY